jgi:CheY-like chemotaxis protein
MFIPRAFEADFVSFVKQERDNLWDYTSLVENGKEAVDAYREQRFNAILMDVQMPVLDGYKTTGVIRMIESRNGTHTPIIAMTAFALKGDKEKCLELGMDDYLSKPIDADEFYATVEKLTKLKKQAED